MLWDQQSVPKIPTLCLGPPVPWDPHCGAPPLPVCRQQGLEDTQTQKQRGQGTHGPMGALTSLTLPALSLEPPSLGPPTPPNHSSLRGRHPPPLGDMGCCGGGHPGVHTSPSTPNPAPWERVRKRGGCGGRMGGDGGHQGHGPWLCVPFSPRRAASSAQHPGAHSWPQPHPCRWKRRRVGDRFWSGSQAASAKGT